MFPLVLWGTSSPILPNAIQLAMVSERRRITPLAPERLGLATQFVEILDIRTRRAVNSLHLGIGRFDHIVFIRRMRSAAVTETEMSRGQPQRIAGEDIARP